VPGTWSLVGGQPVAGSSAQLRLRSGADDECRHDLAPLVVGHTHHGDVSHPWHLSQHVLHLAGVDVEPTSDDQLAEAADEVQIAVATPLTGVSGAEPAVVGEGRPVGLGVLPVTPEHVRPPHLDLAVGGQPHLDVGEGQSYRAGTPLAVDRVRRQHQGLGHPVPLQGRRSGDALDAREQLGRQRR
jgi:ADP-ribose pyrophosphatase YjhB (NUDIX family)